MNTRVAIVGCGAVAEMGHAPSLRALRIDVSALIDPSEQHRRSVANLLRGAPIQSGRAEDVLDQFDAAIVAAPHFLHEEICNKLLLAGKHVLVEKPMAATVRSCASINAAAARGNAKIAVGLMRRQAKASIWLKDALSAGAFGRPKRFVIREGYEFAWPLKTDSLWRREQSGGGVLMDAGAHTMDQVVWWFGTPDSIEYFDDSDGGVEADCLIRMRWEDGLEGEIELSRTRRLSNTVNIFADKGRVSVASMGNDTWGDAAMLQYRSARVGRPSFAGQTMGRLFVDQLKAFLDYLNGKTANIVTGEEGARSLSLIEACYAARKRLDLPWIAYSPAGV